MFTRDPITGAMGIIAATGDVDGSPLRFQRMLHRPDVQSADVLRTCGRVYSWPLTDMPTILANVCFWGKNGHGAEGQRLPPNEALMN